MSTRAVLAVLLLAPILGLLVLVLFASPDGEERSQWLQFVGHFHPLAVHLPIALLVLLPVVEIAGRSRHFPYLLESVDFILGMATLSAIAAALLGWSLARSGGYSGLLVTQHMWGGTLVVVAVWFCFWLRSRGESRSRLIYTVLLIINIGLVSFAGYRGGQLTQGENHLTAHMPARLRAFLGIAAHAETKSSSGKGGPGTYFASAIEPIFVNRCISCHGPTKHKNDLRLDSYDAVMRGGKHGTVIHAADPKGSELFRRVTLPPSSDDFMPSDHKPPLTKNQVQLIEQWIATGASGTRLAESGKESATDSVHNRVVPEVTFEEVDPALMERERSNLAAVVAQLGRRFPNTLDYESRSSIDLVMNASLMGAQFGDKDMAALAPICEHIVVADFSGTAITDHSSGVLSLMKHLRSLRLMHTKITDGTVQMLTALSQLESLNLFDTPVSSASLATLERLPKLRHIYVQQTRIKPEAPTSPEMKEKLVF
jgi:uncharacterized membrane protein